MGHNHFRYNLDCDFTNFNLCIMTSKTTFFFYLAGLILFSSMLYGQGGVLTDRSDAGYDFYTHPDKAMNVPFASVTTDDGHTYIAGTSADYASASGNFVIVCINNDGELVWEKRLPVTSYSAEYGMAIGLDETQNIVVSGVKWNGHDVDMLTLKLNASDGEIIWETLFAGDLPYMDVPYKVVTDESGNIYITGITYTGSNASWLTLKYNSAGSLQWSQVLENSLPDSYIEPEDMHVNAERKKKLRAVWLFPVPSL